MTMRLNARNMPMTATLKMNKELKPYRQKMTAEELQMYLYFRKRGGIPAAKKGKGSYNRKKIKKEVA